MEVRAALHSTAFTASAVAQGTATRAAFIAEGMVLRHLASTAEIAGVLHLRDEIDLSVHAADSNFARLEKKETSSGLCSDSSSTENS
ncbi:MAG: hypothetical protein ABIT82_09670 [Ramlibacter sp.]